MKKLMITATMVLLSAMNMMAQGKLTIDDFSIQGGETKNVAINLINEEIYCSLQFDLVLPTGVTIALNNKSKPDAKMNEDRIDDHTLTTTDLGNGLYRFLIMSLTNADFYGNSGAIINIKVVAASDISAGELTGTIKDAVITPKTGTDTKPAEFTFKITATSASGINEITIDNPADVYDLQGNKVRSKATSTDGLSKGVYIINGQKVIVK